MHPGDGMTRDRAEAIERVRRLALDGRTEEAVELIGGMLQPAGMVSFSRFLTPADAEAIRQYALSEANRLYPQSGAAAP